MVAFKTDYFLGIYRNSPLESGLDTSVEGISSIGYMLLVLFAETNIFVGIVRIGIRTYCLPRPSSIKYQATYITNTIINENHTFIKTKAREIKFWVC